MTQQSVRSRNAVGEIVNNCTLEAKKILDCALEIAIKNRNPECCPEHLALALTRAEANTDVASILTEWPIDEGRLTNQISNQIKSLETYPSNQKTQIYFSKFFKEFLERADTIRLSLDWPLVRSGALFLSFLETIIEHRQHRFFTELARLPIEEIKEYLRSECTNQENQSVQETSKKMSSGTPPLSTGDDILKKFTIDLTAQAQAGKIDPITGREKEIFECIDVLLRKGQNNPILTGEAGVGKTAIVEGLALKIVQKKVPPMLQNVTIRTLDLGLLQAGASVKGEFEDRLKKILEAVQSSPKPIILFIDEAHTMIGAGGQAGQNDVANLLKPALARGELRTIAATTWAEYKKYFEKDSALARRFQVVKIEEPTEEQAIHMLRGMCQSLEKHHGVVILEEALPTAVKLSARFLNDRKLPDKALRILDTACTRVRHSQTSIPSQITILEAEITQLISEETRIKSEVENGYTNLPTDLSPIQLHLSQKQIQKDKLEEQLLRERNLISELMETQNKLKSLYINESDHLQKEDGLRSKISVMKQKLAEIQHQNPLIHPWVDSQTVASIIETWTGIPTRNLVDDEIVNLLSLSHRITNRVVGQDHAIEQIANRIRASRTSLTDPNKPVGVFLLCGPSGVGKTETALAIADIIYGSEKKLITINMSEYQEKHTVSQLKGSPPGYVGYGEGGTLTEAVRRNPYSVVLLDEIEKAHKDVIEFFFQVFDRGMMEDGCGVEINFKNCIFLLTTNLGDRCIERACEPACPLDEKPLAEITEELLSDSNLQPSVPENEPSSLPETSTIDLEKLQKELHAMLVRQFSPAFIGRVQIIPYFPISPEMLQSIITLQVNKVSKRTWEHHKIKLQVEPSVIDTIAARCLESESGARNVTKIIENKLLPSISDIILNSQYEQSPINEITVKADLDGFIFELEDLIGTSLLATR